MCIGSQITQGCCHQPIGLLGLLTRLCWHCLLKQPLTAPLLPADAALVAVTGLSYQLIPCTAAACRHALGCHFTLGPVLHCNKQALSGCCLPYRIPMLQSVPSAGPWWLSHAPQASVIMLFCLRPDCRRLPPAIHRLLCHPLNRLPPGCLSAACRCCPGGCHPHLRHRTGRLPLPHHECHHLSQKRFSPGRPHLHVCIPHSGSSVVHAVPNMCSSALHVVLQARMQQHGAGPAAHCYACLHVSMPLQLGSNAACA